jgi:hypothetical protein
MKNSGSFIRDLIMLISLFILSQANAQDSTAIKKILGEVTYGVPSSPAFELLPNKPSEVTHLSSASDITAHISNFISAGKLQTGAAFDIRPFAYSVGSLTEYQQQSLKRVLWRSVFSLGTASENQTSSDVYIGAGLRIPIIDNGDIRADPRYTTLLEAYQLQSLGKYPQPEFGETSAHYMSRVAQLKDLTDMKKLRDSLIQNNWNAFRLDVGIGGSERAASGFIKSDSLFKDRAGLWLAFGVPITRKGQLTVSGNTAWINAKADTAENNRSIIGARARFFITDGLALSGEYARIYARHGLSIYSENWNHLAIVAEFKIPYLGGWGGLAYGGDSSHRTDSGAKFTFNYAFYTDRMIKK